MDPWAGIRQMIEQPSTSSPDSSMLMLSLSWNEIRPADPISPPSFEMFGEIRFREGSKPSHIPSISNPFPSRSSWIMQEDINDAKGGDGRELGDEEEENDDEGGGHGGDINCDGTEELSFDTLFDVEEPTKGSTKNSCTKGKENGEMLGQSSINDGPILYTRSRSDSVLTCREGFPPPISTIGRGVKPWVYLKSFRKDGRFVLKKMKVPNQHCLQATRENGRLLLLAMQQRKGVDVEEEEKGEGIESSKMNRA